MKQGRKKRYPRQDLEGKNNLLYIVDVREHKARCPVDALCKEVEDQESGEQDQCEFTRRIAARAPTRLEDEAEHERVDREHEQWIEQ